MSDERTPGAVDRHIGKRIRARRLEIGMSQERLAELLGVTFQQVQKYEKGVNRTAASRLYDVAEALDCPVVWFFPPRPGGGPVDDASTTALATTDGQRLVQAFAAANRPRRKAMADAVEAMSRR